MAQGTTPVRKAWRSLTWLGVVVLVLVALQTAGSIFGGWGWAPKLGLDLAGGTQIILTPVVTQGQQVTSNQLNQAVSIIRQRVDASGTSDAQISTQSGNKIVVAIPGTPDQATLDRIKQSSKLEFRAVLETGATPAAAVSPTATPGATTTPVPAQALNYGTPTASPTNGSDLSWVTPELQAQYANFNCSAVNAASANTAPADKPLIACDTTGTSVYLLGPVEVSGSQITDASAGQTTTSTGAATGTWAVNIKFTADGGTAFKAVGNRIISLASPRNQFGAVLDGQVITAPVVQGVTDAPQITGSFTQASATSLANELKFGALPISFQVESQDTISPTLGLSQLESGLLAGLIGLALVVVYSIIQYRALASVTIASLVVAGILTYLIITIMAWREGYRLSLAGVAGLIVGVGFTVDSFIVYFERIRDELRDGRGLVGAVEAGWKRALRTIYAAKGVNLLSAIVLFILAVGTVQGFALTLGITVIIDVLVVVLFTHPMMQLIAATRFFSSGHPASGLDPNALGAVYRGRAEFRITAEARREGASREAERRQTIAERKAAEAARSNGAKRKDG